MFATDDPSPSRTRARGGAAPSDRSGAGARPPAPKAAPATSSGPRPDDIAFGAADAHKVLVALWTKLRLDQIGAADTIEALCDGVSSRRNQLLVDLGAELWLGAIDGAAEADMVTLSTHGRPAGPYLQAVRPGAVRSSIADHLRKVFGPAGKKQAAITERVTKVWQLGAGWANHVLAEVALAHP